MDRVIFNVAVLNQHYGTEPTYAKFPQDAAHIDSGKSKYKMLDAWWKMFKAKPTSKLRYIVRFVAILAVIFKTCERFFFVLE